jgi:hypothetical protein
MFKIRRSLADKYFSDYIRERDDWSCRRCKKEFEKPNRGLHCSHFFSRAKKSVRFDPENAIALCFSCHNYFGGNPADHVSFFKNILGNDRYRLLEIRASIPKKVDESEIALGYKMELKKMKEERKFLK